MSAHTPGPWEIRHGYGLLKCEVGPPGCAVAAVWTKTASTRDEQKDPVAWSEGEANARLIAAAPELLEALRQLRESALHTMATATGWEASMDSCVQRADAAIAKATGAQA